jgi:hypothetical protein
MIILQKINALKLDEKSKKKLKFAPSGLIFHLRLMRIFVIKSLGKFLSAKCIALLVTITIFDIQCTNVKGPRRGKFQFFFTFFIQF